jgi:hypothetical protein
MKKSFFVITALFLFTISVKAQTTASFVGKWKFKDIYQSEKLNAGTAAMLKDMFTDMNMEFKANNTFKFALLGVQEDGSWTYDEPTKTISTKSTKSPNSKLQVISVTANELTIGMGEGKAFILQKAATK